MGKLIYGRKASLVTGFMFDQKDKFIQSQILGMTIQGAFQHIKIYRKDAEKIDNDDKAAFRENVRTYLSDFENEYTSRVASNRHIANIERLLAKINGLHTSILKDGGISFGVAQKLLNLYLKYDWCLGRIEEPPHCPIDAMILEAVGMNKSPWSPWSQMSGEQYNEIIDAIEKTRGGQSIADWELDEWKKAIRAGVEKSVAHHKGKDL